MSGSIFERAVKAVGDMEWDYLGEPPNIHDYSREIVQTVLQAIREPSEGMVVEGLSRADLDGEVYHIADFQRLFTAMIDAALTDAPGPGSAASD